MLLLEIFYRSLCREDALSSFWEDLVMHISGELFKRFVGSHSIHVLNEMDVSECVVALRNFQW